ncbi:phospholipase, partial [Staphylococcus aureus]
MTRASILSAVSAALLIATPAMAQDGIEILISRAALREAGGNVEVDVRLLNASDTQKTVVLPDRVAATLTADD